MRRKNNPRKTGSDLKKFNPRINFEREGVKSNARKDETKVICVKCKKKFVLPFKPRRPDVYCDDCFKNKKKKSSKTSNTNNKTKIFIEE